MEKRAMVKPLTQPKSALRNSGTAVKFKVFIQSFSNNQAFQLALFQLK